MRIFSKFRDYYDTARSYGIDPNIVWERKPRYQTIPRKIKQAVDDIPCMNYYEWGMKKILIGFCGKLYLCWEIDNKFFYTIEKAQEYLIGAKSSYGRIITKSGYKKRVRQAIERKNWKGISFSEKCSKEWYRKNNSNLDQLFIDVGAPTFIIRRDSRDYLYMKINPRLSEIDFQKQFDAWSAFQELSMYVGNILLNREDKIPPVSDKDLLQCKGFDKFSFRKDKRK